MMKPLQLWIFIHNFYCSISVFYFITFLCFTCNKLQQMFPPIFDNHSFSLSIFFLIQILDIFKYLTYNSLCHWFISRLIVILFPIRVARFSITVNMSSLPLIFPTLIIFLVLPNILNHETAFPFTKMLSFSYYISTVI